MLDSGVVPGCKKSLAMQPYSTAASLVRLFSSNSRLELCYRRIDAGAAGSARPAEGHAMPGRSLLSQLSALAGGREDRSGFAVAHSSERTPGGGSALLRWVLSQPPLRFHLRSPEAATRDPRGSDRLPSARRAGCRTGVSIDYHDPRPRTGAGPRTRGVISRALGNRNRPGRIENPSARCADCVAQQDARVSRAGVLRTADGSFCHSWLDARSGAAGQSRSGPALVYP